MSYCSESLFRDVDAAGISHVTGFLRSIDDARADSAPLFRRSERHGRIDKCIAKPRVDNWGKVVSNEHVLSQRNAGPILFGAGRVINRRGLPSGNRVTYFRPGHVLD